MSRGKLVLWEAVVGRVDVCVCVVVCVIRVRGLRQAKRRRW